MGTTTLSELSKGFSYKLGFNLPYLTSLYLTSQGNYDSTAVASWLVTAALYPLSTLKVRNQIFPTQFAIKNDSNLSAKTGLYRGVVPFILLNVLLGWSLRPLFSQEKLESVK